MLHFLAHPACYLLSRSFAHVNYEEYPTAIKNVTRDHKEYHTHTVEILPFHSLKCNLTFQLSCR